MPTRIIEGEIPFGRQSTIVKTAWTAFQNLELQFLAHVRNSICAASFPTQVGAFTDESETVVAHYAKCGLCGKLAGKNYRPRWRFVLTAVNENCLTSLHCATTVTA